MKEQDKISEKWLKEMEISNLLDKEFKLIVHKDACQGQENNAWAKW